MTDQPQEEAPNPLGNLLAALLTKAAEAKAAAPEGDASRLSKPNGQTIDSDWIMWTWESPLDIRAAVSRGTGDYTVVIGDNEVSLADVAALAKTLESVVEWKKIWKLFVADMLLESDSQPSEVAEPKPDQPVVIDKRGTRNGDAPIPVYVDEA